MSEAVLWKPTLESAQATNIHALMVAQACRTFDEIHAWSLANPVAFWEHNLKALGIRLDKPYATMLDLTDGLQNPHWMVGAKMNIATSCFADKGQPNRPAIITRRLNGAMETVSLTTLDALSNRVANGLVAMGLSKGDGVAIAMPMTAEAVAAYLGIVKAGMVVVAIPDSVPPEQMDSRLRIGKAKAIVTQTEIPRGDKRLPLYEKILSLGDKAPRAIVLPPHGEKVTMLLRAGDLAWDDFLAASPLFQAVSCAPDDPTNIIFSSGTTGDPKGIAWTHATPIKSASDGRYHQDIRVGDIVCWPTNLGWMMGPWLIYASLLNRATIALYEGVPNERGFCEFIQNAGVTMLGLVPSIVGGWRKTGHADGLDWSALRCFSSSGEASSPDLYGWLMGLNQPPDTVKPVVEYCGGTETGGGYMSCNLVTPTHPARFNSKVMGMDFVVRNERGEPCSAGETGELFICLSPPSIGLSTSLVNANHHDVYFKGQPEGCRYHGDLLTICEDADGRICWSSNGRAGNDFNANGIKFGSSEIERAANKITGVLETAAIGVPPPTGGADRLVIYAVLHDGVDPVVADRQNLRRQMEQTIRASVSPFISVYAVEIIPELPRTPTFKVMHRKLREIYKTSESMK